MGVNNHPADANKLRATNYVVEHDGETFKRRTFRVYSHLVLQRIDHEQAIAASHKNRVQSWHDLKERNESVATGLTKHWSGRPYTDAETEGARNMLALGAEGWADYMADKARALDSLKYPGRTHHWIVAGWCGRYDLAIKLAAKYPNTTIREVK